MNILFRLIKMLLEIFQRRSQICGSVQMYCNNDAMAFYKSNNVDAFYIYYDVSDNLVGLFRVSNFDC